MNKKETLWRNLKDMPDLTGEKVHKNLQYKLILYDIYNIYI